MAFSSPAGGSRLLSAQEPDELTHLVAQMRDKSPNVRQNGAEELSRLVVEGSIPAGEVAKLLRDPDNHVRSGVVHTMRHARGAAKDAVPVLIELLGEPDKNVRLFAVGALRAIGPEASAAAPILVELLKDPDRYVSRTAAETLSGPLGFVTKDKITPRLVELLKDSDQDVRLYATQALGGIGADTNDAAPILVGYLGGSDQAMRRSAALALGRIRPAAKEAVPGLVALLKTDRDADVRRAAADALGRIWPGVEDPVPQLVDYLKEPDKGVRTVAIEALGRVGPEARHAIPALSAFFGDADKDVRGAAQVALGRIAMGFQGIYEPDVTARQHLEEAREILDTVEGPAGRDLEVRKSIDYAIDHLEQLERSLAINRNTGWLPSASLTSWKTWAAIVPLVGLVVFLVRRLWPIRQRVT